MKAFFEMIGRFVRFVGKVALTVVGWLTIAVLVIVLVPTGYFLWRANQPMSMPEYNGLTYTQFAEWRMMVCEEELAVKAGKECPEKHIFVVQDVAATALPVVLMLIHRPEIYSSVPSAELLPGLWDSFESNMLLVNKMILRSSHVPLPEELAEMQAAP